MLRRVAPAKVNLFLHILGRRADGYHELQSLVVFTQFGDELEFEPTDDGLIRANVFGPALADVEIEHDSMAIAARKLRLLAAHPNPGVAYSLAKQIPIAAGLGGGSSDAAAALHALNDLWESNLNRARLEQIGLEIGADVPVCLRARPTLVEGIGERLTEVSAFPETVFVVLAHTRKALSTADVFKELRRSDWSEVSVTPPAELNTTEALVDFLKTTQNDLEASATRLQPQIGMLLDDIAHQPGCMLARMSGSGAACFGIFASEIEAFAAAERLQHRLWWSVATRLL